MSARPRALAFDLFGTLLDVASLETACRAVTRDPGALVALWRRTQLEHAWLLSLMGRYADFSAVTEGALGQAAGRLGLALDDRARRELAGAWRRLAPYPEAAGALERLGAGRPLAVLSNGDPAMLEDALGAAGLRERFAHVLSVDAVGAYKPAPAVYALAESALGVERRHVLFASANPWDVAGASAFGLPTAWVARAGGPPEAIGGPPGLVVADLVALADAVGPA